MPSSSPTSTSGRATGRPSTSSAGAEQHSPRILGGVTVLTVIATVVGLLITGGASALRVGDPGAFVRWSLPVVSAVGWVASVAALGLLVMAAFVVPETTRTNRRGSAAQWAGLAALVWATALVLETVFSFADLAGLPLTDATLPAQLSKFVFQLEGTRVLSIVAAIALVTGLMVVRTQSRAVMAWGAAAAALGIMLPSLNGHAGGTASHEDAVNSAAVHYLGVAAWVGGLLALVLLRSRLGKDLAVSVRRFSLMATWAYAALALSGLQQGIIRVGSWSGLWTAYGLVMLVKVAAFVALGWLGWRQRSNLAHRLAANPRDGGAFTRLAVTELAVMAAAMGLGVALSRSNPPVPDVTPERSMIQVLTGYPDPGPIRGIDWLTAWQINWLFLSIGLLAMALYAVGVRRLRQRGDTWSWLRTVSWMVGCLVWIYFTNGAGEIWGRVLFSTHMIMHMGISMTVPIFLVLGAPVTLALRALPPRTDKTWGVREVILQVTHSRVMRVLGNPVVAAVLFFASLAAFYYSPLFELALTTHTGHLLMMAHFLLTGYLFAWVLVGIDPGPPRWSPLLLLVILFATVSFHAFFGVALTGSETLLAPGFFDQIGLPWMTDPLADQHKAGMIAWGVGEAPTLTLAVIVALQWFRRDEAEAKRKDRRADRDGDAELTAYNDYLASLRSSSPKE